MQPHHAPVIGPLFVSRGSTPRNRFRYVARLLETCTMLLNPWGGLLFRLVFFFDWKRVGRWERCRSHRQLRVADVKMEKNQAPGRGDAMRPSQPRKRA
jgi:hypothetical protein